MTALRGLYGVATIRRIEAAWLAQAAPGSLMARAAAAVADEATRMLRRLPPETTVLLLVGPGNNGGDALQAGLLLSRRGFAVRACAVATIVTQPPRAPDAAAAWLAWREAGMTLHPLDDEGSWRSGGRPLVVDGLFGIGLTRGLPSSLAPLLAWLAETDAPVLAIDIPSGIDADSGGAVEGGACVRASVTVTMIADKPGLHTGAGLTSAGQVLVASLSDRPDDSAQATGTLSVRGVPADAVLLDVAAARRLLPARRIDAHKGTSGDVLVIGGRLGMTGAARLAARGAIGAGAGKVWIAGDPHATGAADADRPEIMRDPIGSTAPIPPRVKVVVIGCGLGQDRQARQYLLTAIGSSALLVCDADALNLLSAQPRLAQLVRQRQAATILTPHPLEAARLLSWTVARVQADRIAAALELARRFDAVAVVKGPGTVIASPSGQYAINASGNPVLAAGGTGDVLAGIVAGLAAALVGAKHTSTSAGSAAAPAAYAPAAAAAAADAPAAAAAACCAVWLHGAAGDLAARSRGPIGVPAGAMADLLPAVIRSELGEPTACAGGTR